MLNSKIIKTGVLVAAATLFAAGSTAFAHTTIRSQATEGVTEDNAIRIGHTCETADGDHIAVIALSAVFPGDDGVVTVATGTPPKLSEVIEQGTTAGLVRTIQDLNIFSAVQSKFDSNDNQIGFSANYGYMTPHDSVVGRFPFQFAGPRFVATSCARRLLIRVVIADICRRSQPTIEMGKLNLWITDDDSKYATTAKDKGVDGVGAPATLTVNRNLTTNPLPAACGNGIDVIVQPSPASIDANLPIWGYWK